MFKENKHLKNIKPYISSNRFSLSDEWILCDWNESLFPPSPKVNEIIHNFNNANLRLYPDTSQQDLKYKLFEYINKNNCEVETYNGSDDALKDIFSVFIDDSVSVLTFSPSYTQVDTFIDINTHNHTKSHINDPFGSHDYDFSLCKHHDVVYIVNPNNPTGHLISRDTIENLLKDCPDTLFIIDEAYYEFCNLTCVDLIDSYKNIIITRTFSKAFGLASLRLGYAISNNEIISKLRKIKNSKNVNVFSQACGIAALSDIEYLDECIKTTELSKNYLYDNIPSQVKIIKSSGNFVLFQTPSFDRHMKSFCDNKILVRDRSSFMGIDRSFRVSIGPLVLVKKIIEILNQ